MDRLQPQAKREVAILEDGANPNGELLAAAVALPEAMPFDAFRVLLAGLGAHPRKAAKTADFAAMGAGRVAGWPKLTFDVGESGFLGMEPVGVEDGIGHGCLACVCATKLGLGLGLSSVTWPCVFAVNYCSVFGHGLSPNRQCASPAQRPP